MWKSKPARFAMGMSSLGRACKVLGAHLRANALGSGVNVVLSLPGAPLQAAALSGKARSHLDALAKQLGIADKWSLHQEAAAPQDNATVSVNTAGRSR